NGGIPHGAGAHGVIRRPITASDESLQALSIRQAHRQLLICHDSHKQPVRASTRGAWRGSCSASERKGAIEIRSLKIVVPVFARPRSKLHEVLAQGHGSVILELVAIERVIEHALNVAASRECPLNLNRGRGVYRRLNVGGPQELEPGLVDDLCVHNLGIADLQSMFGVDGIVALLSEIELTGAFVFVGVVKILITRRESVGGRQLVVETRTDFVPPAWIGHRIAKLNDLKRIGIHEWRVNYFEVDDIAP